MVLSALHSGGLYTRLRNIPDYHHKLKKTRHFQYCAFLISDNKITYFCLMIQECLILFMRLIDTKTHAEIAFCLCYRSITF